MKTIYSPHTKDHFMTVEPASKTFSAQAGGELLAKSKNVLVIAETGHSAYPPVYYFPIDDVAGDVLTATEKTSHCPLKGDTRYFHLEVGGKTLEDAAWEYSKPLAETEFLKGHVAFDTSRVKITQI